jgi:hypothetical protein
MTRFRTATLCAALLALTVAAYLPIWNNHFIDLDDGTYITDNPGVMEGLSWSGFCWAWTNQDAPYRQPLTWLSLQFDAHFFSSLSPDGKVLLSPAAFHGQSLFWHAASVLLLFGLLGRLRGKAWPSFLVAALFAVHPMHVESVAWAAERKDVLCVFFGLLALAAYLRHVRRPSKLLYLGVLAAYSASLLSKPMLISLPLLLLLLDYWPLRRFGAGTEPLSLRRLIVEKIPLFVLALVMAILTLESRADHGALVSLDALPLSARLANALTAVGWYLASTLCPVRLAILYPHPYDDWSGWQALAGAACLLSVTALALWQGKRRPWLLVGWGWFLVSLAPVLGLAQGGAQAWADRFSYWPHIGLFVALVWEARAALARWRIGMLVSRGAAALVLGSLAALTWVQVGHWRDSVTLWEHTLAVTVDNARAHQHLSLGYRKQGRLAEADFHIDRAHALQSERLRRSLGMPRKPTLNQAALLAPGGEAGSLPGQGVVGGNHHANQATAVAQQRDGGRNAHGQPQQLPLQVVDASGRLVAQGQDDVLGAQTGLGGGPVLLDGDHLHGRFLVELILAGQVARDGDDPAVQPQVAPHYSAMPH